MRSNGKKKKISMHVFFVKWVIYKSFTVDFLHSCHLPFVLLV